MHVYDVRYGVELVLSKTINLITSGEFVCVCCDAFDRHMCSIYVEAVASVLCTPYTC